MALFIFLAGPLFSQDSVVVIKPSTARYFLEVHDEMYLLREKDSISQELISTLSEDLLTKDHIIETFKNDSKTYEKREKALTTHIELQGEIIGKQTKEIKKQKLVKWAAIALGVAGMLLL